MMHVLYGMCKYMYNKIDLIITRFILPLPFLSDPRSRTEEIISLYLSVLSQPIFTSVSLNILEDSQTNTLGSILAWKMIITVFLTLIEM